MLIFFYINFIFLKGKINENHFQTSLPFNIYIIFKFTPNNDNLCFIFYYHFPFFFSLSRLCFDVEIWTRISTSWNGEGGGEEFCWWFLVNHLQKSILVISDFLKLNFIRFANIIFVCKIDFGKKKKVSLTLSKLLSNIALYYRKKVKLWVNELKV